MKKIIMLIIVFFLSYSTASYSSVTMLKTRIVYSSDSRFEVLKFMNNDEIPYIMQIWADKIILIQPQIMQMPLLLFNPPFFVSILKQGETRD
ncbi:hypothetical protein PROPEN_00382 [Proteus penneri ATCC 35198]|nr:hypothetical protein PROPEN_00382 [Proteus penneri ATCC 35198]